MELSPSSQISVREYSDICKNERTHVMIDVRSDVQFKMISFEFYKLSGKNKNEKNGDNEKNKKSEKNEINDGKYFCEEKLKKIDTNENNLEKIEKTKFLKEMNDDLSNLKKSINRNVFVFHVPLGTLRNILSDEKKTEEFRNNLKNGINGKRKEMFQEKRKISENISKIENKNLSDENIENFFLENKNVKINENEAPVENEDKNNEIKSEDNNEDNVFESNIYCLCRRGNDSVLATQLLIKNGFENSFNIIGGVSAWADQVDNDFPSY